MKAVVLGGGGLTGRCTVRDLARGGRFDRIVVGDLDVALAQAAAREAGGAVETARVDVRDPASLAAVLSGADVCVNAVQYNFNLEVMAGCLAAGVPYLDFGGLFHMTRRQLEWDERFRAAGLVAIPGLGQVPGVSNVLAAQAAEGMDRVDSIVIRDGWRDFTENGPEILFTWSPSTFLDEMVLPAMVWEDGRYHEAPAMSGAEEYEFPSPVGKVRVYRTLHSEPATLPHSLASKGVRHVEWKEGGPGIDVLRTMALLGLASDRPLEVRNATVVPREFTLALLKREKLLGVPEGIVPNDWEVMDIELTGSVGGRPETRHAVGRFPPRPDWRLSATEYAVGIGGSVGAEMIASGQVQARGVVPPELAIPAAPFRAALSARGIATAITPPEPALGAVDPRVHPFENR
ncbi:MAG TPA: saccharopine dehydrogenase C-terminal domain-containing protein [Thermoplasmata archaeon]